MPTGDLDRRNKREAKRRATRRKEIRRTIYMAVATVLVLVTFVARDTIRENLKDEESSLELELAQEGLRGELWRTWQSATVEQLHRDFEYLFRLQMPSTIARDRVLDLIPVANVREAALRSMDAFTRIQLEREYLHAKCSEYQLPVDVSAPQVPPDTTQPVMPPPPATAPSGSEWIYHGSETAHCSLSSAYDEYEKRRGAYQIASYSPSRATPSQADADELAELSRSVRRALLDTAGSHLCAVLAIGDAHRDAYRALLERKHQVARRLALASSICYVLFGLGVAIGLYGRLTGLDEGSGGEE